MAGVDSKVTIPAEMQHQQQAATLHLGVVRDVKDPEGRNRVKVECPSINHTGTGNWLNWCEVVGLPVGCGPNSGDFGFWWPMVPGQAVAVSFWDSDYIEPQCWPGPAPAAKPEPKNALIPCEAKTIGDQDVRKGTRIRELKTEAGATIFFDDNGKQECQFIVDWVGSGWFSICPGKKEDAQEKQGEGSQYRQGETRGSKTIMAQTAKLPEEILKDDMQITGHMDLNSQGFAQVAQSKGGVVVYWSGKKEKGEIKIGPYLILDAPSALALLGVGETQIWADGKKGAIYTTRQIIQEQPPIDVLPLFKSILETVQGNFGKYSSGGSSPKVSHGTQESSSEGNGEQA